MSIRPWFKMFPSDYLSGCMQLNAEEKGAYSTVLFMIYDKGGAIEHDPQWIARMVGCSVRKLNQLLASLIERGKLEITADGRIHNVRAKNQLEKEANEARTLGENGAKGGNKKAQNRRELNENNDVAESGLASLPAENPTMPVPYPYPDTLHCIAPDSHSVPNTRNDTIPATAAEPIEPPVRKHAMPSLDQGEGRLAMYFPHLPTDADANLTKRVKAGNKEAHNTRYLHAACLKVCRAAKIPIKGYHGDWETVARWLLDGFHLEDEIVPAIEQHVARFGASYNPPRWLRMFNNEVANFRARSAA